MVVVVLLLAGCYLTMTFILNRCSTQQQFSFSFALSRCFVHLMCLALFVPSQTLHVFLSTHTLAALLNEHKNEIQTMELLRWNVCVGERE